jgi:hypothetical protein
MPRSRQLAALLTILALIGGALVAGGAGAAPRGQAAAAVTLNLKGGVGNRIQRACRIRHHYTLYRRGTRIAFAGTVAGASGAFTVKVKVKQCAGGRFVTRYALRIAGRNGSYGGVLRAAGRGFFFARAYYGAGGTKLTSDKQYFRGM